MQHRSIGAGQNWPSWPGRSSRGGPRWPRPPGGRPRPGSSCRPGRGAGGRRPWPRPGGLRGPGGGPGSAGHRRGPGRPGSVTAGRPPLRVGLRSGPTLRAPPGAPWRNPGHRAGAPAPSRAAGRSPRPRRWGARARDSARHRSPWRRCCYRLGPRPAGQIRRPQGGHCP